MNPHGICIRHKDQRVFHTPTAGLIPEPLVQFFQRNAYVTSPAKVSSKTGYLLSQPVATTVAFKYADTTGIPAMWKTIRCSPSAAPKIAAPASSHANPPGLRACHDSIPVSHLTCLSSGCPAPMSLCKQGAALVGEQSSVGGWVGGWWGATRGTA